MDIGKLTGNNPISVKLDEIDEGPGPYCMSFGFDLKSLKRSIADFGLINTPFVRRSRKGGIDVVIGYRRIIALKSLNRELVPCIDLSDFDLSPVELLLLNLYDNLTARKFNDTEKGMVLSRLLNYIPERDRLREYARLLDIYNERDLELYLKIDELPILMKDSIAAGTLSFKALRLILEMNIPSRSTVFEWISKLNFNFNQQKQFIEYIQDISSKEERTIPNLLKEEQLLKILEDRAMNNPQKAKKVLHIIRSRRFPLLAGAEKSFKQEVDRLELPQNVKIQYPPFFEASDYLLKISFRNGKKLKEAIRSLIQIDRLESIGDPWEEDS
ncbi:MAG: ParB N-terminal domain-containing protein [Deltaproteobacteria bacterium]|nr:ParB N-terminal domain-containing protein [Deltaproteobacteria bacterium]